MIGGGAGTPVWYGLLIMGFHVCASTAAHNTDSSNKATGNTDDNHVDGITRFVTSSEATENETKLEATALQLVRYGHDGQLEVVEKTLHYLEAFVEKPVVVLSVLGGYHQGKSFLMNRLGNLPFGGFNVTNKVDSTTKGVQIWGQTLQVSGTSEATFDVLLVDTEGLAATENDADFDAKIFALTTLLSTQLIYSSISRIDKRDIEYLELLARRAKLFAVKANPNSHSLEPTSTQPQSTMKGSQHALDIDRVAKFPLPALMWVVQSFHFDLPTSPKKWLDGMMDDMGDTDETRSSLRDIFFETDCHTLPSPISSGMWSELPNLDATQLAPEYLTAVDDLVDRLIANIFQVAASEHRTLAVRTGGEIAQLVRLLVTKLNEGMLGSLPSTFHLMLRDQVRSAQDAAAAAHGQKIKTKCAVQLPEPPLSSASMMKCCATVTEEAVDLYNQLLFRSISKMVARGAETLQDRLSNSFYSHSCVTAKQLNDVAIRSFCKDKSDTVLRRFKKSVLEIELPVPAALLMTDLNELHNNAEMQYWQSLPEGSRVWRNDAHDYGEISESMYRQLGLSITSMTESRRTENKKRVDEMFQSAARQAHDRFKARMNEDQRVSVTLQGDRRQCPKIHDIETAVTRIRDTILEAYDADIGRLKPDLKSERGKLVVQLGTSGSLAAPYYRQARRCVTAKATDIAEEVHSQMKQNFATLGVNQQPLSENSLENVCQSQQHGALQTFDVRMTEAQYAENGYSTEVQHTRAALATQLQQSIAKLQAANEKGWKKLIRPALQAAYKMCAQHATESPAGIFYVSWLEMRWYASFPTQVSCILDFALLRAVSRIDLL